MSGIIEMLVTAVLLALTPAPPPPVYVPPPDYYEGSLSRYNPGIMESVIGWRLQHNVPRGFAPYATEYGGYVAVVDCRNVGRAGWLTLTIEEETQPSIYIYVADCTSPGTAAANWMQNPDAPIAAEIDYEAWVRNGIRDGEGAWAVLRLE